MAATIGDYLAKSAALKDASASCKLKMRIVGDQYSTLAGVKRATIKSINGARNLEGQPLIKALTPKEITIFNAIKREIDPGKSLEENFIVLLTANFIQRQLTMLKGFGLDDMNTNPLLCSALKMDTVSDLVKYNVYAAATRSIVTSMGYLIENLLLYSNSDIITGKDFAEGDSNKWDLVIQRLGQVRCYIEVKSGPNDLDKTQIKSYAREIQAVEAEGHRGYIGISYGRKDVETVTTNLLQLYLADWEAHTLIGTELWYFVSGNPDYHEQLMAVIQRTAADILRKKSIIKLIDLKIRQLVSAFNERYPSIEAYYAQLW